MIDVPTRVKDALREGDRLKRYRFVVDSDPIITITNDNLVSESVTFDERMCSDKEIKFGLCEGTNLEFQYFGLPNITGKRLQAFIDVQYKDSDGVVKWYEIPMGWFEVSESSRQASTGIIKVSAFNKLLSDYLDAKANAQLQEILSNSSYWQYSERTLDNLLRYAFEGYAIDEYETTSISYGESLGRTYRGFPIYDATGRLTGESVYVLFYDRKVCIEDADYIDIEGGEMVPHDAYSITGHGNTIRNAAYENADYLDVYIDENQHTLGDVFDLEFFPSLPNRATVYGFYGYNMATAASWSTPIIAGDSTNDYFESPYIQRLISFGGGASKGFYEIRNIPALFIKQTTSEHPSIPSETWEMAAINAGLILQSSDIVVKHQLKTDIGQIVVIDVSSWSDVTLRDLQSAVFETVCQYGKLDRVTDMFSGVELNNSRLLPAEDLYPANDLYPNSIAERSNPAMYSKLWADEGNVRKFRYLIITYKGTETEGGQTREVEKTLQRTVNENGTDDYNMSDNWLFKNLVWTDEEVGDYADAMVAKMQNLTWFPFEMWCAGLPYVETGDELEINVNGEAYTSYVLRRNLRGIQNLQDEMINGELDIF